MSNELKEESIGSLLHEIIKNIENIIAINLKNLIVYYVV